jgi:hypothetical protein
MIQIEILETEIKEGSTILAKGDIVTRPDDLAKVYIDMGWAKNVATGEVKERNMKPQKVSIDKVTQKDYLA